MRGDRVGTSVGDERQARSIKARGADVLVDGEGTLLCRERPLSTIISIAQAARDTDGNHVREIDAISIDQFLGMLEVAAEADGVRISR